jgi:hypothetical protein
MTTSWEEQRPVWRVSGLAEVLMPRIHRPTRDAIVRFDRVGASAIGAPNALSRTNQRRLDQWGYVVISDVGGRDAAEQIVRSVGELIPQPGDDHRSSWQSANVTRVHTQAPGWHPSPAYLSLFCHRQARCGGGHVDLLDVRRLVDELDDDELTLMTEAELHFPGPDGGIHTTMLSTDAVGDTVARFSYNLLTTGDYEPTLGKVVNRSRLPLGEAGHRLALRISELFRELHTSVLIPDGALLIWDNQRMLHAPSEYADRKRHVTRFWSGDWRRA